MKSALSPSAVLAALAVVGLVLAGPAIAEPPGKIEWKANNKLYDAHGSFKSWRFTRVTVPDGDLEKGTVEIEVDLASVWEKADALAEHLRQADFFDVEKYTKSTIKVDRAKKVADGYEAVATIDLHGTTNEVPLSFRVVSEEPLRIEGKTTLSRTAFGIGEPYDAGNDRSIVDDVEIMFDATLPH